MFVSAAKRLSKFLTASQAEVDQLSADARDAADRLRECEYNRLRREYNAAREKLANAHKRQAAQLGKLRAEVYAGCPAADLLDQLRRQSISQAEAIRNHPVDPPTRFDDEARHQAFAAAAAERDRRLSAWVNISQRLPEVRSSATPYTDLRRLIDRHVGTLPELQFIAFEIPASERELADANAN